MFLIVHWFAIKFFFNTIADVILDFIMFFTIFFIVYFLSKKTYLVLSKRFTYALIFGSIIHDGLSL